MKTFLTDRLVAELADIERRIGIQKLEAEGVRFVRHVKLTAPIDNPDAGKFATPDDPETIRAVTKAEAWDAFSDARISMDSIYPRTVRPNLEEIYRENFTSNLPNVYFTHRELNEPVGVEGYGEPFSLAIDCDELLDNDPGRVPSGRPGDVYRTPSWATRLRALHIK